MTGKIIDRRVVPDRYEIFENDNNAKSITFTVPKINDGVDLTTLYAFVNLENENFVTNKVLLSKTINENDITLVLSIDNTISLEDGITKAQITFESADVSIVYCTSIFYIDVKSSVDSYSNTQITAKALYELQADLTKTIDSVNDKIYQALQEAKESFKFAELKIDGIVYDGSLAREVKHAGPTVTELGKAVISSFDGETNDLTVFGTYNYENMDTEVGDGINTCIVKGVGVKVKDENDEHYGEYRVRVTNSNGNFYEPLNASVIESGNASVTTFLNEGTIYVSAKDNVQNIIEVPLKQHFKRNTYYNLKLKYLSGSLPFVNEGPVLSFSLYNKTTLEEKKIDVQHYCGNNIEMRNNMGERFFSGDSGEICIRVHFNTKISSLTRINGMTFFVVIEESDTPCDGYPKRQVTYSDIYLKEPLYKLENIDSETGEFIDGVYDELDLKNSRVIRRVRKGIVRYDDITFVLENEPEFQMYIEAPALYGELPQRYNQKFACFRPSIKMKSPIATNVHEYLFYDQGGYTFYLDQTLFGGYEFDLYDRLPVVFFYPLKTPLVESITPTKISYHKGINVFDIISDYPVEKAVIKM